MKNIHVLQTDNYSPLVNSTSKYGGLFLSKYYSPMKSMGDSYQNIYITIDEEIKDCEYGICLNLVKNGFGSQQAIFKMDSEQRRAMEELGGQEKAEVFKVILTTDQDLIKDGVQAIPDEFLEWFVKNPSCEFVEVNYRLFRYGWFCKIK